MSYIQDNQNLKITDNVTFSGITKARVFVQAAASSTLTNLGGNYYSIQWDTSFQNTTSIFTSGNFANSNARVSVPYNGIYAVSYWFNISSGQEEFLIMNSQGTNDLNIGAANNASIRLMGVFSGSQGSISWMGYLTTSDYFVAGIYSSGAPSVTTSRTGLSVSLISQTS